MNFYEHIEPTIEPMTVGRLIEKLKIYVPDMEVRAYVPTDMYPEPTSYFKPSVEKINDEYVLTFVETKGGGNV